MFLLAAPLCRQNMQQDIGRYIYIPNIYIPLFGLSQKYLHCQPVPCIDAGSRLGDLSLLFSDQ